jgi:hypothetical protein
MSDSDDFDAAGNFPKDDNEWESPKHEAASSEFVGWESMRALTDQFNRTIKLFQEHLRRSFTALTVPGCSGFSFL